MEVATVTIVADGRNEGGKPWGNLAPAFPIFGQYFFFNHICVAASGEH